MNIEAMKIVRENLKTGSILSFAEVMIIQQAIDAAMLQGADGNSPVIPDGWVDVLQRWLVFGRGMQNAGSQLPRGLIAETEAVLAAAPQQEVKQ